MSGEWSSPEGALPGGGETLGLLEPYLRARRFRAGRVLWAEGEVSGRLVLLERGRVKAVRGMPDGSSVLLYVFGPGDLFGFLPFVDGGPYPATTIAVDDVEARVMSRTDLHRAVRENPQVATVLLRALGTRLRQAFSRLGDQAQGSSIVRAAAALSLLLPAEAPGPATIIEVPRPIHSFAADLGMTAETFSRAVTRLVEAGLVRRLSSPRLQILDPRQLRTVAAGHDDPGAPGRKSVGG